MPALEVKDLELSYTKGQHVLKNISFSVDPGEIIAIVGMSGSGKTSLLRAIAGFESPESGEIILNGRLVLEKNSLVKPEKRKLGFVFQDLALFGHLTVAKNIAFGIANKLERSSLTDHLLELVDLRGLGDRLPSQLSGGQQQRVAIARALATKPDLLLMDEPFSSLDKGLKAQVRTEISTILKKSGTAAIIVTHDIEDAYAMANRILVLDGGRVAQFESPELTYLKPANEQVARLGGKANIVDLAQLDLGRGKALIRPEHIQVTEGKNWTVTNAVFHGNYHEYQLSGEGGKLLMHSDRLLETGSLMGIHVEEKHIHKL